MMSTHSMRNRGQTLVEWALVLPLLLLIVFMILDFGRGIYYYSVVHNAAREGARYGLNNPCKTAQIIDFVRGKSIGLSPSELTIVPTTIPDKSCDPGKMVKQIQVSVTYRFTPVTPMIKMLVGTLPMELSSVSVMQVEAYY